MSLKRGIALRLFAFNLLLLFLPIAAILYLDVYEEALLSSQERSMVQQARLDSGADVLEGECRSMEQLERPDPIRHLP